MNQILSLLGVIVFFSAFLVWTFYPELPSSVLGWGALIIIGIPSYLFLEWLSEVVLSSQFFKSRSSFSRIILGVPIVLILLVVALLIVGFVQQSINAIGG
ncbi:hypothetical protein [Shewanella gaetbuli]|uniref:Uncharacterized protein n=1 Tax=Shewanella gaetbuli TaxID=220752 RepID=A0A9X2CLH1_9GAMM|nr:hypothetical protein [Shewanella gaetbuli]MCL1142550.1 hypothetical protein [Shewanella gaetbuli]